MPSEKPVRPVKGKHMTLADRTYIEKGIEAGRRISEIASGIGKDPSTVSKEIRKHRRLSHPCSYPVDCLHYPRCAERRKTPSSCSARWCAGYDPFKCLRRDRSPGACNGCLRIGSCRYEKYRYKAGIAERDYRETLVSSREGLDLTEEEAGRLCQTAAPLILKGQSPYMVTITHPELGISAATLYNYISAGLMAPYGVTDLSLPQKAKRRRMKKKARCVYKKKQDRTYLKGRLYEDYRAFMAREENLYRWVLQLDTVYNSVSGGPFMETMLFVPCTFLLAFYQEERTAEAMVSGIDTLDLLLGADLFTETAGVILTDRGSEFSSAERFETRRDGTRRAHIFYCDPMASCQKPHVENSHELLRRTVPKNSKKKKAAGTDYTDLRALGLTGQEALNEALSHINSVPRRSLDGKTPIQVMQFRKPALWEKMQGFGIREVPPDEVTLDRRILRRFRTGIAGEELEPVSPASPAAGPVFYKLKKTKKKEDR